MKKYNIEGNINFFNELYKSLDDEDECKIEDPNLCLITNQPLSEKYVAMDCGHKFNYIPLYNDIKNHKQKYNNMEGNSGRLNQNEIRCPYCRKKQKNVLPYYDELGLEKINGVNAIDLNYKPSNSIMQEYTFCQFLTPNMYYDLNGINPVEISETNIGNCKFFKCFNNGSKINYSDKTGLLNHNFGDEKYYCYTHKCQKIKMYKKEKADKVKEEAKKVKEEEKMIAKQIKKLEKMKNILMDHTNENNIIGTIDIIEVKQGSLCNVILKNGPNKGKHCGCKVFIDNTCKRHNKS